MTDNAHELQDAHESEPANRLVITDLDTLKVVSDPLRMRIVELLRRGPATVKEIGLALRIAPKKLYYHVNMLEQRALIRVVGTRLVSGLVEKRYRAAAYLFEFQDIAPAGGTPDEESRYEVAARLYDMTRDELRLSVRNGLVDLADGAAPERALQLSWRLSRLPSGAAPELYARLEQLAEEYETAEQAPDTGVGTYRLLLSLFPTYPRGPRPDLSAAE